jgi:hypothetical protein
MAFGDLSRTERAAASVDVLLDVLPAGIVAKLHNEGFDSIESLLRDNFFEIAARTGLKEPQVALLLALCFLLVYFDDTKNRELQRRLMSELSNATQERDTIALVRIFLNRTWNKENVYGDDWISRSFSRFRDHLLFLERGEGVGSPRYRGHFHDDDYDNYRPVEAEMTAVENYKILSARLEETYSRLTSRDAILQRGLASFIPVVFSICWMAWEISVQAPKMMQTSGLFISIANAATAGEFKPPLGLSQPIFTVIVCLFAALLLLLIVALTWAGFFASRKSVKAATIVEHFGSLLLGVFFGTKL